MCLRVCHSGALAVWSEGWRTSGGGPGGRCGCGGPPACALRPVERVHQALHSRHPAGPFGIYPRGPQQPQMPSVGKLGPRSTRAGPDPHHSGAGASCLAGRPAQPPLVIAGRPCLNAPCMPRPHGAVAVWAQWGSVSSQWCFRIEIGGERRRSESRPPCDSTMCTDRRLRVGDMLAAAARPRSPLMCWQWAPGAVRALGSINSAGLAQFGLPAAARPSCKGRDALLQVSAESCDRHGGPHPGTLHCCHCRPCVNSSQLITRDMPGQGAGGSPQPRGPSISRQQECAAVGGGGRQRAQQ